MSGTGSASAAGGKPAVVLLSGGLDSATALAVARREGYVCHALSFAYGQRHGIELDAARDIARRMGCATHVVVEVDFNRLAPSVLTGAGEVPKRDSAEGIGEGPIPSTYVPARNIVFLAFAAARAEAVGARDLFLGVNALDYSGYPDCRPEFIAAFGAALNLGTKSGAEGGRFAIHAPLIALTKAGIIRLGTQLGVDYALTRSCYDPDAEGFACGRCDSCLLRKKGFAEANVPDPTPYRTDR